MLNATQEVNCQAIDERILPTSGLISIFQIIVYCGIYTGRDYVDQLIESLKENNIPIIETSDDKKKWLVNLADFTPNLNKNNI
ncbi:hypothetical protein GQ473_03050 [archaeon]|nr:hypothetical protein [archaeon]